MVSFGFENGILAMQLHLKSFGSGEPLIILHGMLGMLDNWQTFGKEISQKHLVYLVDLRNHGRSAKADLMTYPAMAEDLKETMESQWLYDGAIVLGHSMGGKVAMQLALNYPDLVKALIVIDIAPVEYKGGHEMILAALNQIRLEKITSRQEVYAQLEASISTPAIVNFLMKNLSRSKNGRYEWKMNLKAIGENYSHLLKAPEHHHSPYVGPTLFVKGSQSDYITQNSEKTISSWFPNSRIETIQNAGHWVHADKPGPLQKTIEDFIQRVV